MSVPTSKNDNENQEKSLLQILSPREEHWVGDGFYVSTIFSIMDQPNKYISPFILMDHAAPKNFPPTDQKLGVGEHPHRGFETVTFALQGEIEHRDSGGGGGTIGRGGVQWMTAGSGVVHDEFHSRNFAKQGGPFEMVQLWVNLEAKNKMTKPRYQSLSQDQFSEVFFNDKKAKAEVIAGEFLNAKGPAETYSNINIFKLETFEDTNINLDLKSGTNTLIFQIQGGSEIQNKTLKPRDLAVFDRSGSKIKISANKNSFYLVLNGDPIDEPVAHYGPFVMNTQTEIMQAIQDYQAGRMGTLVQEN